LENLGANMRPLNRPMFKMGGPIKEGIMQGMKDGGLSKQFNTGLVGDERYPKTDGREHHVAFLAPLAFVGGTAARMLAPRAIMGGLRSLAGGLRSGQTVSAFDKGLTGMQRLRNLLPTGRFLNVATPKMRPGASFQYKPAPLRLSEAIRSPEVIGKAIRENPFTAFGVAGQIKNIPDIASGAFDVGKGTLQGAANYLLGTEFGKDKLDKTTSESDLKRVDEIGAGEGTTGGSVVDDPNKKKEIDEDRIAKTKKRYYELMGLDKMKKDAAYDSLIDASNIVAEEGGDLKGAIRSGTLQSRIINAISKNLDKSADIKRQIDAAILKGEIQKDIASADTLKKDLDTARLKALNRAEKQAGASGQIAEVMAKSDGVILGSQTAAILRADGIKYDGVIQDKLFNNFKKDNPAGDEIDFMIAKGKDLDDGRYIIGARLVEKKGNEVAFVV
jgi:hypothetical protein